MTPDEKDPCRQKSQGSPLARSDKLWYGEYDENGVDLSLLRLTLSLTPSERLKLMDKHARDTLKLLEYGRRHREAKS
jgi:hypothetical protein